MTATPTRLDWSLIGVICKYAFVGCYLCTVFLLFGLVLVVVAETRKEVVATLRGISRSHGASRTEQHEAIEAKLDVVIQRLDALATPKP